MIKTDDPLYARVSLNLLTIGLLAAGLYFAQGIVLPLFFSILLAMLLHPVVSFLSRLGIGRVAGILFSIIISLCVIGTIIYLLSSQIGTFLEDIPTLKARLREVLNEAKMWVQETFNIGIREQNQYLSDTKEQMATGGPAMVQQTFVTITGIVSYLIFLPVYAFLILYHKDTIKRFLTELFRRSEEDKVAEVLDESQVICQQYLTGMLIELMIVFSLNATGFLLIGIKYPIFLAMIAALLNIVPYIGMLTANVFCIMITLVSTDDISNIFWVAGVLATVQLVDNNILMPFIVGSKIKINALAIILGVLVGGALCGVPGMFLAIPGLAVMKVVFERVDGLKPWAVLLGDETATRRTHKNPIKRALSHIHRKKVEKKPA